MVYRRRRLRWRMTYIRVDVRSLRAPLAAQARLEIVNNQLCCRDNRL
jgi:hypothetical protein